MELRTDIELKHSAWNAIYSIGPKGENPIFIRIIDLFIVCCAIGISYDETVENNLDEPIYQISRNTYQSNPDLSRIFEFLFQNAVLTSKAIKFEDLNLKMKIAFDPDFQIKDFNPIHFLTGFANFGAEKLSEFIVSNDMGTIDDILGFILKLVDYDFDKFILEFSKETPKEKRISINSFY